MNQIQRDFLDAMLKAKSEFAKARTTRDAFMANMPESAAERMGLSRDEFRAQRRAARARLKAASHVLREIAP